MKTRNRRFPPSRLVVMLEAAWRYGDATGLDAVIRRMMTDILAERDAAMKSSRTMRSLFAAPLHRELRSSVPFRQIACALVRSRHQFEAEADAMVNLVRTIRLQLDCFREPPT